MTVRSVGEQISNGTKDIIVFFEEGGFWRASHLVLLCYIQDARNCVGNSVLWWAEGGHGYTSDLSKAWRVPATWKADRDTDVLRPCAEMDALAERHVDLQKLRKAVAA